MKRILGLVLLGTMIWAIPFVIGIFFYDSSGQLSVDLFLFKSIMILVLTLSVALAINLQFSKIDSSYVENGLTFGLIWLAVPVILDYLILIPMAGMTLRDYTIQIGLRYLIIPIICFSTGLVLSRK